MTCPKGSLILIQRGFLFAVVFLVFHLLINLNGERVDDDEAKKERFAQECNEDETYIGAWESEDGNLVHI